MYDIAWSLRRLYCPTDKNSLVLDVGSGGNPYARANILLDAYKSTRERNWVQLKVDRFMILGFVEKLPFKDHAFDFVIASHVLEHSKNPCQFLSELQRVAKAGYIEVPDAFFERINPYKDHRLEITCRDNKLIIRKKPFWIVDENTVELYENRVKPFLVRKLFKANPFIFHVRYYWKEKIDYVIVNPEVNAEWEPINENIANTQRVRNAKYFLHEKILNLLRLLLSQNKKNRKLDIIKLLICPTCGFDSLLLSADSILCIKCKVVYPVNNNIIEMYSKEDINK
jgi:ubiquinone/menaquinone biosynthesis C-methylase UbiE